MARPAKSVKVKTGAIAGGEEALRGGIEDRLRGQAAQPEPPEHRRISGRFSGTSSNS